MAKKHEPRYRCPKCKGTNIQIVAKVWVQLIELGDEVETDALDSRLTDHDHEWDDESPAKCGDCGHSTKFMAFDTKD